MDTEVRIKRLSQLCVRCQHVEASIQPEENSIIVFDPKRTFLWLALFSEMVTELTSMPNVDIELAEAGAQVLDFFSIWHQQKIYLEQDTTFDGRNSFNVDSQEGHQATLDRIRVALKMGAINLLSLSKCYWVWTDVMCVLDRPHEALDILKMGLNVFIETVKNKYNVDLDFLPILENCPEDIHKAPLDTLTKLFFGETKSKHVIPLHYIIAATQIMKCHARSIGENGQVLHGLYIQMLILNVLEKVYGEGSDGSVQHLINICGESFKGKKGQTLCISLSEFYTMVGNNAHLQGIYDVCKDCYSRALDMNKKQSHRTQTIEEVERSYRVFEQYARTLYLTQNIQKSLEIHQESLQILEKYQNMGYLGKLYKRAHFLISNTMDSLSHYRAALPHIRAACTYTTDSNTREDHEFDGSVFFLAGTLEYRCALDVDSSGEAPPVTAVKELLSQATYWLKRSLGTISKFPDHPLSSKYVALQLAIVYVDLDQEQDAIKMLSDHQVTPDFLFDIDQRRMGARRTSKFVLSDPMFMIVYSVPVWSILMRLANHPSKNEVTTTTN